MVVNQAHAVAKRKHKNNLLRTLSRWIIREEKNTVSFVLKVQLCAVEDTRVLCNVDWAKKGTRSLAPGVLRYVS